MSFNSPPRDLDDEYGAGAEDAMSAADIFADLSNHLEQCGDCYPGALCKIGFDFAIKVIGKNRAVELRNEADQRYGESPVSEQPTSEKSGAVVCPGCGELKIEELVHCTKCGTFLPR